MYSMNLTSHLDKKRTKRKTKKKPVAKKRFSAAAMRLLFTRQCFDSRSNSRSLAADLTSNSSNEVEESKQKHPMRPCVEMQKKVRKSGVTWRSAVQSIRSFLGNPKSQTKPANFIVLENTMIINAGGTSTILNQNMSNTVGTFVLNKPFEDSQP